MSIEYKIDVLKALADKGYSTYRLSAKKDAVFSETVIHNLRHKKPVSFETLSKKCIAVIGPFNTYLI